MAMFVDDIFDASRGLGQCEIAVLDDRCLTEGCKSEYGRRREDRGAGVQNEGVGKGELLAEPGDTFGLGGVEMMNCQDHHRWNKWRFFYIKET